MGAAGLALGLAVFGAACGDDDGGGGAGARSDAPPAGANAGDGEGLYGPVCELLTVADVEGVLGEGVELDDGNEDIGACHYSASDDITVVTFQVLPDHAYDTNLEAFSEGAAFGDVDDLGDRATWSEDAFVGGFLMVLAGDRTYSISGAGSQATSVDLMEQALSRL